MCIDFICNTSIQRKVTDASCIYPLWKKRTTHQHKKRSSLDRAFDVDVLFFFCMSFARPDYRGMDPPLVTLYVLLFLFML